MQTFVVRVWVPGIEAAAGETLRGFVTAASSGVTVPFHEEAELLALIRPTTEAMRLSRVEEREVRP